MLHICCAPDATSVFERLCEKFNVTGFFYNPQIEPQEEYCKRLVETRKVADAMGFKLIEGPRDVDEWTKFIHGLEDEPEKGRRCELCYKFRLQATAKLAASERFNYFTTTLSVSPHKSFNWLRDMGNALALKYGVEFLAEDFKKQEGFKRSLEISNELGLYRQDYCGCEASLKARKRTIAEQDRLFRQFADKLRACSRCSEFLEPAVVFQGGANRPIFIIGQAPGRHELKSLKPFSGPAGKRLWQWFADLGYKEELIRSKAHITAVAKCYPGLASNGKDDASPSGQQRRNCLSWLEAEFSHARPKLLILIGSVAAKTILGKTAGMDLVGELVQKRIWKRKVQIIVLPHPSGLNRWPNMSSNKPKFAAALQILKKELDRIFT